MKTALRRLLCGFFSASLSEFNIWKCFFTISILFVLGASTLKTQCLALPFAPVCVPLGSTPLLNNDVVGVGQTYNLNGTASYANITMNGGTLVICGNLTVTNFVFNSGTVIIKPGASLNLNMALALVMGANSSIYNYGVFNSTSSIVTGSNNIIYNCLPGSIFNINFNQIVIQGPNTSFVNNGTVSSGFFIVQSNNSGTVICSGAGSVITTNTFINSYPNAFSSPGGPSCIFIGSQVINSQPVTNSSNVKICYMAASVSIIGTANFGAATVNNNCSSCSVALPVELVDFSAHCDEGVQGIKIAWSTASETNNDYFELQKSRDAIIWTAINQADGEGFSNAMHNYEFMDHDISSDFFYYRLKQVDYDGNYKIYDPIPVSCSLVPVFYIYPNPANEYVSLVFPAGTQGEAHLEIIDVWGRQVLSIVKDIKAFRAGNANISLLAAGGYILRVTTSTTVYTTRLVVKK